MIISVRSGSLHNFYIKLVMIFFLFRNFFCFLWLYVVSWLAYIWWENTLLCCLAIKVKILLQIFINARPSVYIGGISLMRQFKNRNWTAFINTYLKMTPISPRFIKNSPYMGYRIICYYLFYNTLIIYFLFDHLVWYYCRQFFFFVLTVMF